MTVRSFVLRQNPAYRPGGSRIFSGLVVALILGCAPQVPRQEPSPVTARPVAEPPRVPTSWRITPSPLAAEYLVEQRAVIQTTNDSGTFSDTTALLTEVSLRRTSDGGFAGLIQSAALAAQGSQPIPLPGIAVPLAFSVLPALRGEFTGPVLRPGPSAGPCRTAGEIPLGGVRDLLVLLPDSVSVGATWSDSGSYQTCRDGAVLTVTTHRAFRVRGFRADSGEGSLSIDRTTRTTLRGSAARGDDTTLVQGTGTGTMTIFVHGRTGAVLSAEGSGSLEIIVRGRTKLERARQVLQSRIARRTR